MTFDGDQLSSEVARSRVERNVSNISGNLTQAFYRFQGRKLVHSLRISKGSTVFDLGSGSGFLKNMEQSIMALIPMKSRWQWHRSFTVPKVFSAVIFHKM